MLEKTMRLNYLLDFYQTLLTPKQRSYMELYYLDDYSLGEIAEEFEISRQAVYDNIKRTEQMLEDYESKLGLFERFQNQKNIVTKLRNILIENNLIEVNDIEELLTQLEKLD